ncbi:MAG TPA: D-alanyl-D-alanine carboxypeptidase [Clostridiaceae bacterium]|nr:D-alanyl-D-alanine carboxypeptidase [Clostridiaceae bacterium]
MKKIKSRFPEISKMFILILIAMFCIQLFSPSVLAEDNTGGVIISIQEDETIKVVYSDQTWLYPRKVVGTPTGGRENHVYPNLAQVAASNYIVADLETEEVLLGHRVDDVAYPASMTKIMTALTVIESPDFDLNKPVVFSEYAVALPSPVSARAGFLAGEETTTENALYLMMVQSANECARALAETYGGTEANFADMMNELAASIGCENTHLVDAAGFGLDDHHFTPRDLVKIIKRAMTHDIFRKLVTTRAYASEPSSYHPYTAWNMVVNSNYLMLQGDLNLSSEYLHTFDGVKTGNTDIAGNCLSATVHTYDGRHLCGIIFNGSLADSPGEFFSVSVLLRTLLEEGAKKAECPTEKEAYQFLADNPQIAKEVGGFQDLCHISQLYKDDQLSDEQIAALVEYSDHDDGIVAGESSQSDTSENAATDQSEQSAQIGEAGQSEHNQPLSANGEHNDSVSQGNNSFLSLIGQKKMQYLLLGMWILLFLVIIVLIITTILKSKPKKPKSNL